MQTFWPFSTGEPYGHGLLLSARKYFRRQTIGYGGIEAKIANRPPKVDEITMALENQCNFTCPTCRPHSLANTLSACQLQRGWKFFYEHLPHLRVISLGGIR